MQEEMEEAAQCQALIVSQKQLRAAIKGVQDQIAQLEKRNKAQSQRTHKGNRSFGDAPEAVYVEPKPPDPSRIHQTPTSKTHNHHVVNSRFEYNSFADKVFTFSGKRGYLIWERNLDEWFHYNNILKEERLAYAIDQLRDDAFKWWVQEEDDRWYYKEPTIKTWRALKELMRYEFAPKYTSAEIQEIYPMRYPTHGSKEARKVVPKEGHRSLIHQYQIRPNQRPMVFYDQYQPYKVPKAMEKKNLVSQDTLARHKEKSDKPIFQEKAKVSPILDKFVYKSSPTGMSHLYLSKDVKTGPEVEKDTISTSLLESKVVHDLSLRDKEILNPKKEEPSSQCKSSNSEDLKYQTCYRCHKKGHYAVVCPTKQALIETSLEEKTDLSMKSDSFIQSDLLVPSSCVMHLSLSKGDVTGTKEHEFKGEEPPGATPVMDQKMVQDTMQSMLLKEAKPVNEVSYQGKCLTPPRYTSTDVCVLDVGSKNESYLLTEVPQKEPGHKLSHEPPHKWKPKSKQWIVQIPKPMVRFILDQHVLNISMIDIMHLLFVQSVETISGCQEESFKEIPPDYLTLLGESTPRNIRNEATKTLKDNPLQKRRNDHVKSRGVIHYYFLKGEPPDTQSIPKPKQSQGKALESQKRMKADLLYLGAGYIVLRSKPCQEGGDVVALKSVVQPESHQTSQTDHLGGTSNQGSVQGVYLQNQKNNQHETIFIRFYTQDGVHPNWNQAKILTEQEVMNFTSQRFLSPSICEYPTLEADSSPRKARPEPNPIIGFKRDLASFQQAQ